MQRGFRIQSTLPREPSAQYQEQSLDVEDVLGTVGANLFARGRMNPALRGEPARNPHVKQSTTPWTGTCSVGWMNTPTLPLQLYLDALHERNNALREGEVATYIPELAKADPAWFGISIVTVDGYVYAVGDTDRPFTIQSMSKPAVYAAALADRGREHVLKKVGVEPS